MSSASDEEALKGGHAPAIKVGGKRVAAHKPSGDKPEAMTDEDKQEYGSPPKVDMHHQTVLVSGALMKGDQEFSASALKYHDKPVPVHEKRPLVQNIHQIHQPGKR